MDGTDRAPELGAFLAGIPFFASFDEGTLVWLARQFEPARAQAGDAIIAEGDPGDGLYVLLSGRLRVSVSAAGGGERVLHDLGRGAVIGEIALLSDRMRPATVRAVRDSDLLLHPPVPGIGVLDFKAGAALIETGYRHAAEALADSGIPGRFA